MFARDLMTPDPFTVTPSDSIQRAAELMRNVDVGCLPVVHDPKGRVLVGMITDRDIVVRCVAAGHGTGCTVAEHMTTPPLRTVPPDASALDVIEQMEDGNVRRVAVLNSDNRVVGIIAQRRVTAPERTSAPVAR